MKKLNLLVGILIGFMIFSCSSEESSNDNLETHNVKKITKLSTSSSSEATNDFTYNDNNQINTTNYFEGGLNYVGERFYDTQNKIISTSSVNHLNQTFQRNYFYDVSERLTGAYAEREGIIFDDYTITYEIDNIVSITGTINSSLGADYELILDNQGKVIGNTNNSVLFQYDSNNNLIGIKYFNFNNELYKEIIIAYDNHNNPFYQDYNSNYLDIFLDNFYPDADTTIYYASEVGMLSLFLNNVLSITVFENNIQIEKQTFNFTDNFTTLEVNYISSNDSDTSNYLIEYFE